MTISMFQASIPIFIRILTNLAGVLNKGAAYAEARRWRWGDAVMK